MEFFQRRLLVEVVETDDPLQLHGDLGQILAKAIVEISGNAGSLFAAVITAAS